MDSPNFPYLHDPDFIHMVKTKILVSGNDPVDISEDRRRDIERQVNGQLKPVLRPGDFSSFDLNEAFKIVCSMADAISV
jgi:hypothetical protein